MHPPRLRVTSPRLDAIKSDSAVTAARSSDKACGAYVLSVTPTMSGEALRHRKGFLHPPS